MNLLNEVNTGADTSDIDDVQSGTIVSQSGELVAAVRRAARRWSILEEAERVERGIDLLLANVEDQSALEARSRTTSWLATDSDVSRESSFSLESMWEGIVVRVGRESFEARVTPIGSGDTEYVITLPIDDLDDADRDRLEPGSLFYWNIGRDLSRRPRRRVSEFWLRRIDLSSIPSADPEAVESFKDLFADD